MRELSLHILDVLHNSLEAGASLIELRIAEDLSHDLLTITVQDNGHGMSPEHLARSTDPFFSTRDRRRVGLGIPLLQAAADRCNGGVMLTSAPGQGTLLQATFQHSHIDRAPLGDIETALLSIILADLDCELRYTHRLDGRVFEFSTRDIRFAVGELPLTHPMARRWLQSFIAEGEAQLQLP